MTWQRGSIGSLLTVLLAVLAVPLCLGRYGLWVMSLATGFGAWAGDAGDRLGSERLGQALMLLGTGVALLLGFALLVGVGLAIALVFGLGAERLGQWLWRTTHRKVGG